MGPGKYFFTQNGSGQFFVARVEWGTDGHLQFGFGKFPLKIQKFSIFFLWSKNLFGSGQKVPGSKMGQPLNYSGSKVWSGRVKFL